MNVLKKTVLLALLLGALLIAIGVFLPATRTIERSIVIDAPQATVFALVNNPGQFSAWSPLPEIDPYVDMTVSGATRGAGSTFAWQGSIAGVGSRTITDSEPHSRVVSRLDIDGARRATSSIVLDTTDQGTSVRWIEFRDFGRNIVWRFNGPVMERMLGPEIELGLSNLKNYAENLPGADFAGLQIEEIEIAPMDIAFISASSVPTAGAISTTLSQAYFRILSFINSEGLQIAGAPLSISRAYDGAELRFDVAIPVSGDFDAIALDDSGVLIGKTYGGPVLRAVHKGPYGQLATTHARIAAYIAANGIRRNGDSWEAYVSDPTQIAEADLITLVYYPVTDMADAAQAR